MRRADKALEESKAILNKQLNYTSSTVSRTEDSPLSKEIKIKQARQAVAFILLSVLYVNLRF